MTTGGGSTVGVTDFEARRGGAPSKGHGIGGET